MSRNFTLVQDEDSHWYVIPSDKVKEWGSSEVQAKMNETGNCPDWADPVGGSPSLVVFSDYQID